MLKQLHNLSIFVAWAVMATTLAAVTVPSSVALAASKPVSIVADDGSRGDAVDGIDGGQSATTSEAPDTYFEARVVRILASRDKRDKNGHVTTQQNLELRGLTGDWIDKTFTINGISDVEMATVSAYRAGDRVVVQYTPGDGGQDVFVITDYVRRGSLYWLLALFVAIVLIISGRKGLKALLSLVVSFIVIMGFILPAILHGHNPLLVGLGGSFAILSVIIYLTDGWNRKTHLSVAAVFCSLTVTLCLSVAFTSLTRLTGFASEEAAMLSWMGKFNIDFRGLLLAGIMIGAVGVLDDVIIGQTEAVAQIQDINPHMPKGEVFRRAYKVGNAHLGAIVNTLFLTYAGASLPLLLLFSMKQPPFETFGQVINNETLATEIVRTFVGGIGVVLSMPIATFFAANWLKPERRGHRH